MTDGPNENPQKLTNLQQLIVDRQQILQSDRYQGVCSALTELDAQSRESWQDPIENVKFQESIFDIILQLQDLRNQKDINTLFYDEVMRVVKTIADSHAWRTLRFDRLLAEILISHNRTGALHPVDSRAELEQAKQIAEGGHLVLMNDLTNFLRYGDLTVVRDGFLQLEEVKNTEKKATGGRITRQTQAREIINALLRGDTNILVQNDFTHITANFEDFDPSGYHQTLDELIQLAREKGYAVKYPESFLAIEVYDINVESDYGPRPFIDGEYIAYSSFSPFGQYPDAAGSPTYGVFPLKPKDCFDLITGRLIVRTTINIPKFKNFLAENAFTLESFQLTDEEVKAFNADVHRNPKGSELQARIRRERKRHYVLTHNELSNSVLIDHSGFSMIVRDLIKAKDFVRFNDRRFRLVKMLEMAGEFEYGSTNVHLRTDERNLWR